MEYIGLYDYNNLVYEEDTRPHELFCHKLAVSILHPARDGRGGSQEGAEPMMFNQTWEERSWRRKWETNQSDTFELLHSLLCNPTHLNFWVKVL